MPKVEVTFDIDANGILSVNAKDTATGKDQKITITANSGLNEAEIQKMVRDAAENEAEDKKRREAVERRNKLDSMVYQLEKSLSENKDKIPAAEIATFESLVKEGREAVEKQDDDLIAAALEKLEKESHRIAQMMYNAGTAGAPGAPGTEGAAPPGGEPAAAKTDGVIDAEFEDGSAS